MINEKIIYQLFLDFRLQKQISKKIRRNTSKKIIFNEYLTFHRRDIHFKKALEQFVSRHFISFSSQGGRDNGLFVLFCLFMFFPDWFCCRINHWSKKVFCGELLHTIRVAIQLFSFYGLSKKQLYWWKNVRVVNSFRA